MNTTLQQTAFSAAAIIGHVLAESLVMAAKDERYFRTEQLCDVTLSKGIDITKKDEERRMIYGWASVVTKKGVPVIDSQNDEIEMHELQSAVEEYMKNSRRADGMHELPGIGYMVHSLILDRDIQKALGIPDDAMDCEGWFVGIKVEDDATWEQVKNGTLRAFSIGGQATRETA